MQITVATQEAQRSFYPTPPALAEKLLAGIDWKTIHSVLEPSAGKGNLVDVAATQHAIHTSSDRFNMSIDCIEIDPCLRSLMLNEYSEKTENMVSERFRELDRKKELTDVEKFEWKQLWLLRNTLMYNEVRIVHDDFLTFESRKKYDLIMMNPPFADGDKHLLKAISLAESYGGMIRCILNAETLRNLCTFSRKELWRRLNELGAHIQYSTQEFINAERPTNVEVAIIQIQVPEPDYRTDPDTIFSKLKAAAQKEQEPVDEATQLTPYAFLERMVAQFNFEINAGLRLIREYNAMRPYIMCNWDKEDRYNEPTLSLVVNRRSKGKHDPHNVNKYLMLVRNKYWRALFSNKEFMGKLTSNLQSKYRDMVDELANYDFSMFNIQKLILEMNAEMAQGVIDTILALFDSMTVKHSYYPECSANIHYFNGWKTNKAHKVNKKVILPQYGLFYDSRFSHLYRNAFKVDDAYRVLADIEKAFNYLDGNMTAEVDLRRTLDSAASNGITKNIVCKYFDVTLYKKGTVHIKFTNSELLDRFNIFCAKQRGWLPPVYGKASYSTMTQEEKEVVDSFHGTDNAPGSGEKAYSEVLKRASYYLAPPNQQTLALPNAQAS